MIKQRNNRSTNINKNIPLDIYIIYIHKSYTEQADKHAIKIVYAKIYNFKSFLKFDLNDINVLAFLMFLDKTFHITQPLYWKALLP